MSIEKYIEKKKELKNLINELRGIGCSEKVIMDDIKEILVYPPFFY